MIRPPPRSTRTDTLFPYTTLFRSGFSPALAEAERGLKRFMYDRLYFHPDQIAAAEKARNVVARLFVAYSQDSSLMPDEWQADLPTEEPRRSRVIADFIAGMSDRFAMTRCTDIYGEAPRGLINV